jgi:hypothetical protein
MAWSVALACASVGEPTRVFQHGLRWDSERAATTARRLYPGSSSSGDTVLDFAMWPYEDEVFVGSYAAPSGHDALIVCDRRFFRLDDAARTAADQVAAVLPGASCGVLVLDSVLSGCWFRWYSDGRLLRDVFVTADDGVVVDQGARLPAEEPFWAVIDAGSSDVPLPFGHEDFGLELARAYMFGRPLVSRDGDGFLALDLPLWRFKRR